MNNLYACILSLFLLLSILPGSSAFAQTNTTWSQRPKLQVSGFVDAFYAYDFNKPEDHERQPFLFNHNRHNEFNLNLGLVQLEIEHPKYRANLALQTGTYANDNYAAEPGVLKNIFEANAGISLNPKNTLWLDAGIFPSHLGFESAISLDNPTLTRSLVAESSPYFLSGARLTYSPTEKLDLVALVNNGWQRIERVKGNSLLSYGTQINYEATERITLNWSTFIGTDDPDATRRMRYFSNLYEQFQISSAWSLTAGFDAGAQQKARNSSSYDYWTGLAVITRYAFSNRWATAFRAEYYQDKAGVIIPTPTPHSFKATGLSLNLDYTPIPNVAARVEGRWFSNPDPIFEHGSGFSRNNVFITSSLAIAFGR